MVISEIYMHFHVFELVSGRCLFLEDEFVVETKGFLGVAPVFLRRARLFVQVGRPEKDLFGPKSTLEIVSGALTRTVE